MLLFFNKHHLRRTHYFGCFLHCLPTLSFFSMEHSVIVAYLLLYKNIPALPKVSDILVHFRGPSSEFEALINRAHFSQAPAVGTLASSSLRLLGCFHKDIDFEGFGEI